MGDFKTVALALTVAATLLTGCASAEGESSGPLAEPTEALKSEAPAFHFESGTLELGDFDPETLGDDLFDPCAEITEAEFAAAGMTGVELFNGGQPDSNGSSGCAVDKELPSTFRMIVMNAADRQVLENDPSRVVKSSPDSSVPGAFTHSLVDEGGRLCFAQVDTIRGGLSVAYSIANGLHKELDSCERALSNLEALYGLAEETTFHQS